VALVRSGDDDELDARMRCGLFSGTYGNSGDVSENAIRVAGAHNGEVDTGNCSEERSVEGLAGVTVPYEPGAYGSRSVVRHWLVCSPD
jgi:hypothetical protein